MPVTAVGDGDELALFEARKLDEAIAAEIVGPAVDGDFHGLRDPSLAQAVRAACTPHEHAPLNGAGFLTDIDAADYAELIEWAARQDWSTGAVGLIGVSYLAVSQWRVAALAPPSLKARRAAEKSRTSIIASSRGPPLGRAYLFRVVRGTAP